MKAITLYQPWASLVALGLKKFETRSWETQYRGELAIHAAARPFVHATSGKVLDRQADLAWLTALELAYEAGLLTDKSRIPFSHELPLGCVVAVADLEACYEMLPGHGPRVLNYEPPTYRPGRCEICIESQSELERAVGDWRPGRYAWELGNVRPLVEPVRCVGRQRLWTISDATLSAMEERV